MASRPLKVFLSCTGEVAELPKRRSFVDAARAAVERANHVVVHMSTWGPHSTTPARLCRKRVLACDVYVGILGFRYGSLVPDVHPPLSYTELEFDTASEKGVPQLVLLIDEEPSVLLPRNFLVDEANGDRQENFRRRVHTVTTATVKSPDELELHLYQGLKENFDDVRRGDRPVPASYLLGLPDAHRAMLERMNAPGLSYLRSRLEVADVVALLGPGASSPLYPTWPGLVSELLGRVNLAQADRDRISMMMPDRPEAALRNLKSVVDSRHFGEELGQLFQQRRDPLTGFRFTAVQAAVVRRPVRGAISTSPDPGIRLARNALRVDSPMTSFATWEDAATVARWRSGKIFDDGGLPILFSHGDEHRPAAIVLGEDDHARARSHREPFGGIFDRLVRDLWVRENLCWIGFPASDPRLDRARRAVFGDDPSDDDVPDGPQRNVILAPWDPQAWDPDEARTHPDFLQRGLEASLHAHVLLYPAPRGDHSALALLLDDLPDYEPAPVPAAGPTVHGHPCTSNGHTGSTRPTTSPAGTMISTTCSATRTTPAPG